MARVQLKAHPVNFKIISLSSLSLFHERSIPPPVVSVTGQQGDQGALLHIAGGIALSIALYDKKVNGTISKLMLGSVGQYYCTVEVFVLQD